MMPNCSAAPNIEIKLPNNIFFTCCCSGIAVTQQFQGHLENLILHLFELQLEIYDEVLFNQLENLTI